ncbi:hypothetical protein [Nocardia sp. XZ_19_385]|uniref:hypothetical protein n=1 Tax=Nocardia sp. XZ_19_385 TaxID=2769488 RepID=UPI00188DFDB4|nr:hypothetical protein [Nocardia sp. XZ_19_385]
MTVDESVGDSKQAFGWAARPRIPKSGGGAGTIDVIALFEISRGVVAHPRQS